MTLKQFNIPEEYICDVTERQEYYRIKDKDNPSPEDLILILKGTHKITITSNKDHPIFTELRNELERCGYIKTMRNCSNGDQVIKGFKLNEWTFKKGHRFTCAAALQASISCARKYGWKSISSL